MPPRTRFYEPLIEGAPAPYDAPEPRPDPSGPIQAVVVEAPGMYLRVEDVVATLRGMAFDLGHRSELSAREAVESAADAFALVGQPAGSDEPTEAATDSQATPQPVLEEVVHDHGVYRVEVFPDESGKWYARSVDREGNILETRNGSIDHDYIINAAQGRWPGVEIRELPDAQMDSVWEDEHASFGWNGRRRPSPRRLWAGLG